MSSKPTTTAVPPKTPENSNPNVTSKSPLTTKSNSKTTKSASRNPNLSDKNNKKKKASAVTPTKLKLESKCSSGKAQPEEKKSFTAELAGDEQVVDEAELCPKVEVSESCGLVKSGVCRSNIKRGNVMNLIQAFERILILPLKNEEDDNADDDSFKLQSPLFEEYSIVTQSPATGSLHLDSGGTSPSCDGSSFSQERLGSRSINDKSD